MSHCLAASEGGAGHGGGGLLADGPGGLERVPRPAGAVVAARPGRRIARGGGGRAGVRHPLLRRADGRRRRRPVHPQRRVGAALPARRARGRRVRPARHAARQVRGRDPHRGRHRRRERRAHGRRGRGARRGRRGRRPRGLRHPDGRGRHAGRARGQQRRHFERSRET